MTRAEQILQLLREEPRTFEELQMLTHLSSPILRTALSNLRKNGYMEPVPQTYAATEKAVEGERLKIDWEARRPVKSRETLRPQSVVEIAIRTIPNSVFSLGRAYE